MTEKTTNFFSFENNPLLGTARKAGKSGCDIFAGVAHEQIAGESKFVDLSARQFYAFADATNIEEMIKASREWFGETFKIAIEHGTNAGRIVQDGVSDYFADVRNPVEGVMDKAEETIDNTTRIVEEAAA